MRLCDMVSSSFVISRHNTEIDKAMSTWSRLTCYSRLSPAQAVCGRQPYISQPSRHGRVLLAAEQNYCAGD